MFGRFRVLLMTALALLVLGIQAAPSTTAERTLLSAAQMHAVVGGAGTSTTGIPFPQNFISSDFATHRVKWNEPGNRCQFNCSTLGPTNVGFDVGTLIAQISGGGTPKLEVYADGQGRASTLASYATTLAGFDIFTASLTTKCKGGSNNGQQCNTNAQCFPGGGICSACNQAGECNGDGMGADDLLPCAKICRGDTSDPLNINGKICTATFECGNGACVPAIETGAQTCYLLGRCGSGTGGGLCTQDCTTNGAKDNADGSNPYAAGPLHTAFIRILAGNGNELNRDETVFRMVGATSVGGNTCDGTDE